jgi:hypothetical protein
MSGRGKASGYTLKASDAPIIFGMVARSDRDHDIAAWFGVNQGRFVEVKEKKQIGNSYLLARPRPERIGRCGVRSDDQVTCHNLHNFIGQNNRFSYSEAASQ